MTALTVAGMILVLAAIIGVGLYSGRKVNDAGDFLTGGGKAGPWLVCGTIMGSLVSSQATIGTAQLAFHYGLAAWWFTLGSGIGCLILALGYALPLRHSGCVTELQIVSKEYGAFAGSIGSVLCSVGIFISVLAQVVACVGLITVLFPSCTILSAAVISVGIMCFYVIFGGAWGAGMGGVTKLLLLYAASVIGMVCALLATGGASGLLDSLNTLLSGTELGSIQEMAGLSNLMDGSDIAQRFLNLTSRGVSKDIGSGLSLLLGVLSTQTYAQAIWSAETDKKAKKGALLSAALIPPIGIASICIGLFMRSHYILQEEADALLQMGMSVPDLPVLESTIQVFPAFVVNHLPPLLAGMVLGTLLITVVGGGAGLSLGMATIMLKDIYKRVTKRIDTPKKELAVTRWTIAAILVTAVIITTTVSGGVINDFGFLSMGLRGTVVFLPMSCAIWLPGKIDRRLIVVSIVIAPVAVLLGTFLKLPFDPLFLGVAVSALCCGVGFEIARKTKQRLAS